ncbi:hypothetical protein M2E31_24790, partial [Klebsiella pneumoniae]|nr:hypothetical protein [Klebsiella pneumoniae]
FAGKKSAQIREILISESAWEEMTCLFAPSLNPIRQIHAITLLLPPGKALSALFPPAPLRLNLAVLFI